MICFGSIIALSGVAFMVVGSVVDSIVFSGTGVMVYLAGVYVVMEAMVHRHMQESI